LARARLIKPGFYANEQLAECSLLARFIFPGLWMLADRRGRLEDRPKRIKGELLRYDDGDVDALLAELERNGLIARYCIGDQRLIQILEFEKHQHCHVREPESALPERDLTMPSTGLRTDSSHTKTPEKDVPSTGLAPVQHRSGPADTEAVIGNRYTEAEAVKDDTAAGAANPPATAPPPVKRSRKPATTTVPDGFGISDEVRAWAQRKGFDRLDDHLEAFIGKAKAKPYLYADWDQALQNAIREDWAGIRNSTGPPRARKREQNLAEREAATMDEITGRGKRNERDITDASARVDRATIHALPVGVREPLRSDVGKSEPDRSASNVG